MPNDIASTIPIEPTGEDRTETGACIIFCGNFEKESISTHIPVEALPCYQTVASKNGPTPHYPLVPLPYDIASNDSQEAHTAIGTHENECLSRFLRNYDWILLVIGEDSESLLIASLIGRLALERDKPVFAFSYANPQSQSNKQNCAITWANFLCLCPRDIPLRLAAEVIWSSVMRQAVALEFSDLLGLSGKVQLKWFPVRKDVPDRIPDILSQFGDIEPRQMLLAAMVMPTDFSMTEFVSVGEHLLDLSHEKYFVEMALSFTETLPFGLYLFVG